MGIRKETCIMDMEYMTAKELAELVSHRSKHSGIKIQEALHQVIEEHPYASASDIGRELNLRKERFHLFQMVQAKLEDDALRHEEEMIGGLKETGNSDDDT